MSYVLVPLWSDLIASVRDLSFAPRDFARDLLVLRGNEDPRLTVFSLALLLQKRESFSWQEERLLKMICAKIYSKTWKLAVTL